MCIKFDILDNIDHSAIRNIQILVKKTLKQKTRRIPYLKTV